MNKNNGNDCVLDVEISVNDRNVALNDFSEKMIARTIFGMLSALKQVPVEDGFNKVEIIIKKDIN